MWTFTNVVAVGLFLSGTTFLWQVCAGRPERPAGTG